MKKVLNLLLIAMLSVAMISCGESKDSEGEANEAETTNKVEAVEETSSNPLENKGIGPISSVEIAEEVDADMAAAGEEVFTAKCSACHKTDKKFIGPNPTGVLERRSPEWVMNMILNPEEMTQNDPDAKALLIEFNGAPMANQNLTEEEARSVLEYFRTL